MPEAYGPAATDTPPFRLTEIGGPTSYSGVMTPPPPRPSLLENAPQLFQRVDAAARLLATAEAVPSDIEALVDSFDAVLYASQPEAGLSGVDPYLGEALLGGAIVCLKSLRN